MTFEELVQAIATAEDLYNSKQMFEAKAVANELVEQQILLTNSELLAKVYKILGNVHFHTSDFTKAIEYYFLSLNIYEEIGDKPGMEGNLGNIGSVYWSLSEHSKAFEFMFKSLQINEEIDNKDSIARDLGNIAMVYLNISDYPSALEYCFKSLHIYEEIDNYTGIARNLGNIGNIYNALKEHSKALEYYTTALKIDEKLSNKGGIAANLGNIGLVYLGILDYSHALEYLQKALVLNEEIGNDNFMASNLVNIGRVYNDLSEYSKALEYYRKALYIFENIGNKVGIVANFGNIGFIYKKLSDFPKALEFMKRGYDLSIEIGSKNYTMQFLKEFSEIYELKNDIDSAFTYFKQYIGVKDEIQSEEAKNKAQLFDQRRKIEEDEKARQLKLARFQEQEKILHNILPINIADRILTHETFIADHFQSVSVLFMDLVGFTKLSSIAPPKQLVYLLDTIFTTADEIIESFGLEKIKTIGDGYLAVANVTSPLEEHQKATAFAALQLLETMKEFTVNIPSDLGATDWIKDMKELEIRIGIHTGEVVAGIIGKNKYTYDLWGDAVNVASRMESNSEAGRIHISEEFAKSIENHSEFLLIPRGEISIKGKGTMNTFWLEKRK